MSKVWKTALCFVLVSSIMVTAAGPKGGRDIVRITGEIAAIDAANLQLSVDDGQIVTIVQVTEDTVITVTVKKVKEVIPFEELDVEMTVKVCGKMIEDVLVADQINVMYGGK
jgi:hypothetical protein